MEGQERQKSLGPVGDADSLPAAAQLERRQKAELALGAVCSGIGRETVVYDARLLGWSHSPM
jgi:hypothetical protein